MKKNHLYGGKPNYFEIKKTDKSQVNGSEDRNFPCSTEEHSLDSYSKLLSTKKAKRIRFFKNGDKYYNGFVVAVTPEKYRCFDSLIADLTRTLSTNVTLPTGVHIIYTVEGKKIHSIDEFQDGKNYVAAGKNEIFRKIDYSNNKYKESRITELPLSSTNNFQHVSLIPNFRAKIITLIRNGIKPRKVVRLLLNKKNCASMNSVLQAITEIIKLNSGVVRRVYGLSGQSVTSLDQFFDKNEIFIVYGTEKPNSDDFNLDAEEVKYIHSFRRNQDTKSCNKILPQMPPRKLAKQTTGSITQSKSPFFGLPDFLHSRYIIGKVIGDGNFAIVRECQEKCTGTSYAIKIIDKSKCVGKETMLTSEVTILRQICHPNIISLIEVKETDSHLSLVMELIQGGDLFDVIASVTKFSESDASIMIKHLCSALSYLHANNIVHRDVKPENLLVQIVGNKIHRLKLADFGLAQVIQEPLFTVCGTPTYVAPEILAEVGYGFKIDVWAAGVILYILLCGFPPFVTSNNEQEKLFDLILSAQYEFSPPYWDKVSDSAKELVSHMLQSQPELRYSADDVLDHSWTLCGGNQDNI